MKQIGHRSVANKMDKFFLVPLPITGSLLHIRFALDLTYSGLSQLGQKGLGRFKDLPSGRQNQYRLQSS
jgi:hypothetical protein